MAATDVIVIGAGMIGATAAWRCAQRGLSVRVIDPDPTRGAWHTAAGMLAATSELHYAESRLLRLNVESLARYEAFTSELTEATGLPTGFSQCGTVTVAGDAADLAALRDLHAFGQTLGVETRLLTAGELRELEPALSPSLPGGVLAPGDHQVDPRLLHRAIATAGQRSGVRTIAATGHIEVSGDRVDGVVLEDGSRLAAQTVVLAAGAWSSRVGLPPALAPPVRPVKGQTLRLRLPGEPVIGHVVRGTVEGWPMYVVPRDDGRLVVGASVEETGYDLSPRAGAVYQLLRDAQAVLPELAEATLEEVSTGLRPGSPDNAPVIGPAGIEGFVLATGHYRNGVLLAPVTADAVADLITTGAVPERIAPFAPARFREAVSV